MRGTDSASVVVIVEVAMVDIPSGCRARWEVARTISLLTEISRFVARPPLLMLWSG